MPFEPMAPPKVSNHALQETMRALGQLCQILDTSARWQIRVLAPPLPLLLDRARRGGR